jgi:copper chaperone CopZ
MNSIPRLAAADTARGGGSDFSLPGYKLETQMRRTVLLATVAVALGLACSSPVYSDEPAAPTKATFLITGLHCAPCTSTVQNSLTRVKGVKSVTVDWNKKNAKIEFDESLLPAQALASAIDTTPHMMGAGMKYGGWLTLKVPSIGDEASGQKVKDVLSKMDGVKTVAVYPAQHSAAVLFAGKGTISSRQMIELLGNEGIEATNF